MINLQIPYGSSVLTCQLPEASVLTSHIESFHPECSGAELVAQAMTAPLGTPPLETLASEARTAVVLISDHTRPVPSQDILPQMLAALRRGNPAISVTLLVATGCHRGSTREELISKLGREIVEHEHILIHDAFNPSNHVEIGILPSGAPLVVDRPAVDTDLLIAEGFIEPHFFAGFSGGVGVLFGTTGGYIIGFLASALLMWGIETVCGRGKIVLAVSMVLGLVVCYAIGTFWFMAVYAKTSGAVGLGTVLGGCVIPFIIPDLIKIGIALLLTERFRKVIA